MVERLQEMRRANQARPTPPTERGEATKREILEVASRMFAEGGYAGTSLNDIIAGAGVTKGAFYFHFPSKEALALSVLRFKQEQWAGRVVAATMKHHSASQQILAMVDALIDLHEQDPSAKSIGRLCTELSENPALIPQLAPQFSTWIDLTASLFRKAQEEGTVRADLDPYAMGEAGVATFMGLEMMTQIEGRPLRPRVRRYVELFLRAFGTEEFVAALPDTPPTP